MSKTDDSEAQLKNAELDRSKILIMRGKIAELRFRYSAAEAYHRKALEIMERVLGPDHPDTKTTRRILTSTIAAQQRSARNVAPGA